MRRTLGDGIVTLREATDEDRPAIERGLADPDVVLRFGAIQEPVERVLELNRERWRDGSGPTFAVCDADEAVSGLVWVNRSRDDPRRGAVGFWLLPEARGRGLASRAVRLTVGWAFADMGLDRLGRLAESDNGRSRAVAAATGFRETGERRTGTLFDGRVVEYLFHERVDSRPGHSSDG